MSDLEEPPAKVLKIDQIDGVTKVTESTEYPAPYDGVSEEMLGEESGIIEGGASESQEEWLSEGILTDDDYNPQSQETSDRTDSQLESSQEEEHLDSTLGSEVLPENEQDFTQNAQKLDETEQKLDENDLNEGENEKNDSNLVINEQNEADLAQDGVYEHEEHLADTSLESEQLMESEGNAEIDHDRMEIDTTVGSDVCNSTQTGTQNNENQQMSSTSEPQTIEKLLEMSNLECESETYTEACTVQSDATNVACDTTSDIQGEANLCKEIKQSVDINIEEAMKNLDGDVKSDEIENLLQKNTDVTTQPSTTTESKPEQDDGNDTDDLLRMLGEDETKSKKKLTKTVKDIRSSARAPDSTDDDDDDDFVYEDTKIRKLKMAQSVLAKKKMATKAEPEDMDDIESESKALKNIFELKSGSSVLKQNQKKSPASFLNILEKPKMADTPKQYHNKRLGQSLLKPGTPSTRVVSATNTPSVPIYQNRTVVKPAAANNSATIRTVERPTKVANVSIRKVETKTSEQKPRSELNARLNQKNEQKNERLNSINQKNEINGKLNLGQKNEQKAQGVKQVKSESVMREVEPGTMRVAEEVVDEEFLDEDEFDLDEDELAESESDMTAHRQRIMRPEIMDEEVPSDADSVEEDGSIYDEMPTSDSDDPDDWFQLDIRSERATDYLPFLGSRAKELLLEEKRRVGARLATLRDSHRGLAASAAQQAAALRRATAALAEIDDMIRAA